MMKTSHLDDSEKEQNVSEKHTRAVNLPLASFKRPKRAGKFREQVTQLRFMMPAGNIITLSAAQTLTIGRQLGNQSSVDLDLDPHGAAQEGVSRTHAVIAVRDDGVFLKDFDSRNGTFLNKSELYPLREYPVTDGDTITLGRFNMVVQFVTAEA